VIRFVCCVFAALFLAAALIGLVRFFTFNEQAVAVDLSSLIAMLHSFGAPSQITSSIQGSVNQLNSVINKMVRQSILAGVLAGFAMCVLLVQLLLLFAIERNTRAAKGAAAESTEAPAPLKGGGGRFCGVCGAKLESGEVFCGVCGAKAE